MTGFDAVEDFQELNEASVRLLGTSMEVRELTQKWINAVAPHRYTYLFTALGRPIIQFPQDMVALQELVWSVRPDLIIEIGIAHGGSLIQSASMLALLDMCDAIESADGSMEPGRSRRKVLGIDIDIREPNRVEIERHPMSSRIEMIEGSSIDKGVVRRVHSFASAYGTVLLLLDSNHTHDHVLAELDAYTSLVTVDSYCVVYDTVIEDMPAGSFPDRPWDVGNNPKTAVHEFLATHPEFVVDRSIQDKLQITVAPDGYLRRIGASE